MYSWEMNEVSLSLEFTNCFIEMKENSWSLSKDHAEQMQTSEDWTQTSVFADII